MRMKAKEFYKIYLESNNKDETLVEIASLMFNELKQ